MKKIFLVLLACTLFSTIHSVLAQDRFDEFKKLFNENESVLQLIDEGIYGSVAVKKVLSGSNEQYIAIAVVDTGLFIEKIETVPLFEGGIVQSPEIFIGYGNNRQILVVTETTKDGIMYSTKNNSRIYLVVIDTLLDKILLNTVAGHHSPYMFRITGYIEKVLILSNGDIAIHEFAYGIQESSPRGKRIIDEEKFTIISFSETGSGECFYSRSTEQVKK